MAQPSISDLIYRGLGSAVGGPVDLTTMIMRPFGYSTPSEQVIGSGEWINKQLEQSGIVSAARSPIQEFIASLLVPSPTGGATALSKGGSVIPALVGMARYDKPIEAFHGTTKVFDEFADIPTSKTPNYYYDESVAIFNKLGSHFGSKQAADDILKSKLEMSSRDVDWKLAKEMQQRYPGTEIYPSGANVRPVQLGLQNTYELGKESNLSSLMLAAGIPEDSKMAPALKAKKIKAFLQRMGYDGIEYINEFEAPGSISYIVLNPTQVKSKFQK